MPEYEYRVSTELFDRVERAVGPYDASLTAYLDSAAREGWELVQLGDWQVGFGSEGKREVVLRRETKTL